MPIFFQQAIDATTRLAVWKLDEAESFFNVPLQRDITHPHKRLQHLAGRYLLRHLFADFPLDLIKIADTRKPYLENEAYHFSISHCGDYAAAIASSSKRVGIDIEVPTVRVERIKDKFLHPDERAMSSRMQFVKCEPEPGGPPMPDGNEAYQPLTLLWSAKEAVFKWWSYGKVDFSEMIRLQPFEPQPSGSFDAYFDSGAERWPLQLHYRLLPQLCLAWVAQ